MKEYRKNNIRITVQAAAFFTLAAVIAIYNLYTSKILDFKLLGIGDLNPYGGWSELRELATDSSYTFDSISRSMALTAALLTVAILGGRFFCGWICPLGALQDFSSWLGGKAGVKGFRIPEKKGFSPVYIKYFILMALLLISSLGYGAALAGFSPWRALLSLPKLGSAWTELWPGFVILAGSLLASMFVSRFFCRYLCPLGAAQALCSSVSLISLRPGKGCGSCGKCLENCPAGIRSISPECIRCLNCMENCRAGKEWSYRLAIGGKNLRPKAYAAFMLAVFLSVWLGMPVLFAGGSIAGSIPSGALKDGTYQGEARGFAGNIVTEVTLANGRIVEIKVLKHKESRGWYEEVFMRLPEDIIKKQRLDIDTVSGATKTSRGLVKSVENAVKKALR